MTIVDLGGVEEREIPPLCLYTRGGWRNVLPIQGVLVAETSPPDVEGGTDGRTCGKCASLRGFVISTLARSSPMRKPEKTGRRCVTRYFTWKQTCYCGG